MVARRAEAAAIRRAKTAPRMPAPANNRAAIHWTRAVAARARTSTCAENIPRKGFSGLGSVSPRSGSSTAWGADCTTTSRVALVGARRQILGGSTAPLNKGRATWARKEGRNILVRFKATTTKS